MPPELVIDDEDYASSEDSDFAPDEAPDQGDGQSSDSEGEGEGVGEGDADDAAKPAPAAKRKRQRKAGAGEGDAAEDAGFENSGDEAIIEKGKKKRKKGPQARQIDDEGGEGGLIKTRSMRAVEKAERKTQVVSGPVTIDVDALWASMAAAPVVPAKQADPRENTDKSTTALQEPGQNNEQAAAAGKENDPGEMIKIKRTYNFAGKVHTEEKLVPRDSAEARLYLASQAESGDKAEPDQPDQPPDKRMPRKAFRSAFEPVIITAEQGQRRDLNLGMAVRLQARHEKAKKVNVVEKSRMDWAGFVDKEGIKDELALAGKSKGSFANRQDFLARSEARREEEARRVRLAGKT
ncbi:SWR1-complex protein 5 [Cytospora mali]|uniref:SWR1-complex protein 5 n=1 Tax=Cytospora mali TaxID=578113 RepID=A0A194V5E6_CYTMA|nr:SWR1-complex protein 5 [Valsa mali var. pyri (nom. inval.)]